MQDDDAVVDVALAESAGDMSLHQRILGDIEQRILSGECDLPLRISSRLD